MSEVREARAFLFQIFVGTAGAVLFFLFLARVAFGVRDAMSFGRFELVRLDVAVALALLVPVAGLFERARRLLGPPPAPGDRATALLLPLVAIALVLGASPGLFMESLGGTVAVVTTLAVLTAVAMYRLRPSESAPFAAWLVISSFVLMAAFQIGGRPVMAQLLVNRA
ncbi:MAG TPA: hypothetical protein VGR00_12020 [Thermoanaerobaculia bacterium]|nr:hypothetical protein [Thermoanaerobaculia bacterium]